MVDDKIAHSCTLHENLIWFAIYQGISLFISQFIDLIIFVTIIKISRENMV